MILLLSLWLRLWRLGEISVPYFDEQYHVPAIIAMSRGDLAQVFNYLDPTVRSWDWLHPPLAKYVAAWSVSLLGEHAGAWRLPSAVVGVLVLLVYYFFLIFIARQFLYQRSKRKARSLALGGTVLLASSGLLLVQSRIAMNDIWLTLWLLLASWSFLWWLLQRERLWRLLLTGVLLGLALASKWTGLWLILLFAVVASWRPQAWRELPFRLFSLLVVPSAIYIVSFAPLLVKPKGVSRFVALQQVVWESQLTNPSTHQDSSKPWSWPLGGRAVHYYADVGSDLYLFENPFLLTYSLLAVSFVLLWRRGHHLLKLSEGERPRQAITFLFLCYLSSFLPFIFFSRIMFLYHYLPSLPFMIAITIYVWQSYFSTLPRSFWFNFYFWPIWYSILAYPLWTALRLYF